VRISFLDHLHVQPYAVALRVCMLLLLQDYNHVLEPVIVLTVMERAHSLVRCVCAPVCILDTWEMLGE
jgi:hypothetical protein